MKKVFLILIAVIVTILTILMVAGCKSTAAMQPAEVEFVGSDFEISLPENWEGGTKAELDSVIEKLRELNQRQLADKVEANKFYLLFFGYNSEEAAQGSSVSDFTITGDSEVFLPLDEYVNLSYTSLSKAYEEAGYEFKNIEENIVPMGNYEEVSRVIFEQTVEGVKTKVAQYIIKHEPDFWVLTFITDPEQFDNNIQDFDKTIESFKIID